MTGPHLSSMTGYARASGLAGDVHWAWELKSVNAKAFELRLRVPLGSDAVEPAARARIAARIKRGTVQAGLTFQRSPMTQTVRLNQANLAALMAALKDVAVPDWIGPASLDGLLALPGVVETADSTARDDEEIAPAVLAGLDAALDRCVAMRGREGDALGAILRDRLDTIGRLTRDADAAPGRTPDAVRSRLRQRIASLRAEVPALDEIRLYQEALLMAGKADVREELDRLALHRAAAASLLDEGGAIGRRLDFLAQELAREAGTLCAKSNDGSLTAIGLDLRTQIDQFREQVQNLE